MAGGAAVLSLSQLSSRRALLCGASCSDRGIQGGRGKAGRSWKTAELFWDVVRLTQLAYADGDARLAGHVGDDDRFRPGAWRARPARPARLASAAADGSVDVGEPEVAADHDLHALRRRHSRGGAEGLQTVASPILTAVPAPLARQDDLHHHHVQRGVDRGLALHPGGAPSLRRAVVVEVLQLRDAALHVGLHAVDLPRHGALQHRPRLLHALRDARREGIFSSADSRSSPSVAFAMFAAARSACSSPGSTICAGVDSSVSIAAAFSNPWKDLSARSISSRCRFCRSAVAMLVARGCGAAWAVVPR